MIKEFKDEYRWLSNFWPSEVAFEGLVYPTVEHAYQAAKTLGTAERINIRDCRSPGKAKRLGRTVSLRSDWDSIKLEVMSDLLAEKFEIPQLQRKLLDTMDIQIVEGNTWNDTFWGVCNGVGENNLGRLIMEIRQDLIKSR
jgi:ribA/ribD-fused uncharacterized protein